MNLTRRMFLKGAGGVTVGLPLLEATSGKAWAQNQGPKRFIVFMTPQGFIMDAWRPSGTQQSWQLSQILSPLAPFKNKINVIDRTENEVNYLNQQSNGHNAAARTLLTAQPFAANVDGSGRLRPARDQVGDGFANGPSLDHYIAQRLNAQTPLLTLDLGVGGRDPYETTILHAGVNDPKTLNGDPRDVFNRLFSELPASGSGGGGTPPPPPSPTVTTLDRIRANRGSVLDTVRTSFSRLQARLGSTDRARLEAHADKIRTLESRFPDTPINDAPPPTPVPIAGCEQPSLPSFPNRYDPGNAFYDDVSARAMIDQMVMAMVCDMTRVGTLQFTQYQGPTFPWLDVNVPGGYSNWHAMIHEGQRGSGRDSMIQVMTWYTEMYAYLLQQLDSIDEGGGTMLDNSIVLWISDFGDGGGHDTYDLPFTMAGSAGGAIATNQYINGRGYWHSDLYTAILNAFGIPDNSFGWAELNDGPLPGLLI